jgi:Anti-sigma factor NepR
MQAGKDPKRQFDNEHPDDKEADTMQAEFLPASEKSRVALDDRVRAQLGRQLSAYYTELVNQPVPEKFIELLRQLERSEQDK